MAKHLSFKEKLNLEDKRKKIKEKLKLLRRKRAYYKYINDYEEANKITPVIKDLQKEARRLLHIISYAKKSKHGGMYGINGVCYKMFGKRARDLTTEEKKEYSKVKTAECRAKRLKKELELEDK